MGDNLRASRPFLDPDMPDQQKSSIRLIHGLAGIAICGTLMALSAPVPRPQDQNAMGGDPMGMQDMGMGGMEMVPSDLAPEFSPERIAFFESKVRPLLIGACGGCHSDNGSRIRAGFKIDSRDAMLIGGDSGPAIVPGDPDASLLIEAVRYHDPGFQMPPRGALRPDEISILEQWVAMGAPMPKPRVADRDAAPGTEFRWSDEEIERGRSHWAYTPIQTPPSPATSNDDWARVELDRFVLAELDARGVKPTEDADHPTWLRRVTFDLTGLPPTPEEQASFLADTRPGAFDRVVDRLLGSPAFGERWGRHWLDVARYAESSGKETNVIYPHAWRYRDWVVSAFNQDVPYDRFISMQLAGDLLPANSEDEEAANLIATGYLALGTKSHATRGRAQFVADVVDEQIDATTQGLLATTVACARCHDHKFDPIPQSDYYALAGIFASTETRFGGVEANQTRHVSSLIEIPAGADLPDGPRLSDATRKFAERQREQSRRQIAEAEEVRAGNRGRGSMNRNQLPADLQRILQRGRQASGRLRVSETLLSRFDAEGRPTIENFVCMGAVEGDPRDVPLLERGELDQARALVRRGFPRLLSSGNTESIRSGSGRLELAEWITDERHPLTARVWANRVWQHLFGRGIVPTPDNFGLSGRPPTNLPLLDHLASGLQESGWSTKALIRGIVLSRSYGLSSIPRRGEEPRQVRDVDILVDGMARKRPLEAEALRDSMLAISGRLDSSAPVGSVAATLEGPMRENILDRIMEQGLPEYEAHRSIYLPVVRGGIIDDLATFDFPEPEFVTGERDRTNVATQALYLMNSDSVATFADSFARRVIARADSFTERTLMIFSLAYGREPGSYEYRACRDFLQDIERTLRKDREKTVTPSNPRSRRRGGRNSNPRGSQIDLELKVWSTLCQTIFQSTEFRTLD
jgi:mono/diheme cytochrome c family protein